MRIGIIAGEASGDLLAAGLIDAIKARYPDAQFEGIAGPKMVASGCRAIYPAEKLAVMGLVEVLGRYRELRAIQCDIIRHFKKNPPDLFVGIDAPDFTLKVEYKLKQSGVKTAHYVSPSVWAWRSYRVKKIVRSVDMMLTLFPFEAAFYESHQVPVKFVGHPLADMIPLQVDRMTARHSLALPEEAEIIALLPGSRMSEVEALAETMLQTAQWCRQKRPNLHFVAPLATAATMQRFTEIAQSSGVGLTLTILQGQAREVMAAADVVLLASGTATLEAMLLKRPMVVTYRQPALTYAVAKRLLTTPYVSLPNLLAQRQVVDELLQEQAQPERLGEALLSYLETPAKGVALRALFDDIHQQLRRGASGEAATTLLNLIA